MAQMNLPLTYGIEEEFFLVDPDTRRLALDVPKALMRECRARFGERVHEEMLRAQIEITTPPLIATEQAREYLGELRSGVDRIASKFGLRLLAAGTHPLADWNEQSVSEGARYEKLVDDFQIVGRRNLFCGLHVHVGVPDGVDRIQLMNRLLPWLPMFLALSTSSPFWGGRRTGLLSYRQAAYDEWPRSGVPDSFQDEVEYRGFVDLLARCGAIRDGSFLWWAIRPSVRYPTLELRIADACTRRADSLALAAAFRCLVRAHLRRPDLGQRVSALSRRVVDENRWRAKRYGTDASFIDEETRSLVSVRDMLARFSLLVAPDAHAFDCEREICRLAAICDQGTSAHRQLAIYREQRERICTREAALQSVVDWLIRHTATEEPNERNDDGRGYRPGSVGVVSA